MLVSQTESYFENPYYRSAEEPFCWLQNEISKKKRLPALRQKPAQVLQIQKNKWNWNNS